jgi:hypothetical protein
MLPLKNNRYKHMKKIFVFISCFILKNVCAQISDFKSLDFTNPDKIAKLNTNENLDNLPLLAFKLTNNFDTDVEKFRAIYTWVATNIEADYNQDTKVTNKRRKFKNDSISYIKWNNDYKKIAFKKLLKHKKTICTGYAYLIKELCFLANIECEIIDGYGRNIFTNIDTLELINHSWNAVKLNNKWYLCDATWSSGFMINHIFLKIYNDGYFLTDPVLFAQNHYPSNKKWLLDSTLIKNDFIPSPMVYTETFTHKIIPIHPAKMNVETTKDEIINFSFKSLNPIEVNKISLVKFSGSSQESCDIIDLKNENGLVSFNYKFKHRGFHDVHIKIENDIVATYTIHVSKG